MAEFFSIITFVPITGARNELIIYLCIALAVFATIYILQCIGLYTLAKRERLPVWMAFVPFFNSYLLGKVAGECSFLRMKIKNCGVWFAVTDAVYCLACAFSFVPKFLLRDYYVEVDYYYQYSGFPDSLAWADVTDTVMGYVLPVIELVYLFFMIVVLFSFFRKYAVKNSMFFTVACILFPVKGAFIFAVRNNAAIRYEDYVNAQREAYYRRQQQQYEAYRRANTPPPPNNNRKDDPFSEFSDKTKEEKKSQYSDNDEFFN